MKSILVILVFLFATSSCKKAEANLESTISAIKLPPKAEAAGSNTDAEMSSPENKNTPTVEQKIIKEGNIRFETTDLKATYDQIHKSLIESGATIQNDTEGKDYESVYRKLIIRVPSQNFDIFIQELSKGVAYFDNKEITAQDVTAEFIDLDARLKAKKVLENRYLELLKKANKVSEMLEIEAQLSAIREEIEAKEGQLNYMQNQVSFSTITVEFYKAVANESGITTSYGMKIWTAIKSGFNSMSSLFINLLSIWPFILILTGFIYFIRKKIKTKKI
jgi:hypothetical protein